MIFRCSFPDGMSWLDYSWKRCNSALPSLHSFAIFVDMSIWRLGFNKTVGTSTSNQIRYTTACMKLTNLLTFKSLGDYVDICCGEGLHWTFYNTDQRSLIMLESWTILLRVWLYKIREHILPESGIAFTAMTTRLYSLRSIDPCLMKIHLSSKRDLSCLDVTEFGPSYPTIPQVRFMSDWSLLHLDCNSVLNYEILKMCPRLPMYFKP